MLIFYRARPTLSSFAETSKAISWLSNVRGALRRTLSSSYRAPPAPSCALARCLKNATIGWEVLLAAIWLPDPRIRSEREQARFRLHLVKHKSMLAHRIHSTMLTFGHPCPVSDLFGVAGRELLDRLEIPEGRSPPATPDTARSFMDDNQSSFIETISRSDDAQGR
jgi:hypothetical protein